MRSLPTPAKSVGWSLPKEDAADSLLLAYALHDLPCSTIEEDDAAGVRDADHAWPPPELKGGNPASGATAHGEHDAPAAGVHIPTFDDAIVVTAPKQIGRLVPENIYVDHV